MISSLKSVKMQRVLCLLLVGLFVPGIFPPPVSCGEKMKRCLIVASYHDGFPGQLLKVGGARSVLAGRCEIRQFNMDTKRNPLAAFCRKRGLEAKALIASWEPDIVIAIDDNASRCLVAPFFKDSKIPFVFSGLDWTADEYGYPFTNATGMIEVYPLKQLLREIGRIVPGAKTAVCIRGERLSSKKVYQRFRKECGKRGIEVSDRPVTDMEGFEKAYAAAQSYDFINFINHSGIEGWDPVRAKRFIFWNSMKLTVSQLEWMAPLVMVALTQVVEEQGVYAAEVALKILDGALPSRFPIVANRKWNTYVNKHLLERAGIRIPRDLFRKAVKVE